MLLVRNTGAHGQAMQPPVLQLLRQLRQIAAELQQATPAFPHWASLVQVRAQKRFPFASSRQS
jgi:hypothetical protein